GADLSRSRCLDLLRQADDWELAVALGQLAHSRGAAAELHASTLAGRAEGVGGARRRLAEHRSARTVEVAGEGVQDVDQPAGQRSELLCACADAAVDDGGGRGGQLARQTPD